jgi:hypothetical protein
MASPTTEKIIGPPIISATEAKINLRIKYAPHSRLPYIYFGEQIYLSSQQA